MSRSSTRGLLQAYGAHAARVTATAWPFQFGIVESYDGNKHVAIVKIDRGGGSSYTPPPCQIASPFWGQRYGSQAGLPIGSQVFLGAIDPSGTQYVILGMTRNDEDTGFGIPSDDYEVKDKRGSFVNWTAARSGALRIFGAVVATLFGARVELGSENLDPVNDAVIRKSDLDAYGVAQAAAFQAQLTAWALANLPGGNGASGPTLVPVLSTGSSKVKAAP